jgi:LysM repeat protein
MLDDHAPRGPTPGQLVVGVLAAVVVVAAASFAGIAAVSGIGAPDAPKAVSSAALARLPVYWIVRRGDTFSTIAARTGLSIADLEQFNADITPESIVPGQRLKLRPHVPPPPPKPKGPRFWRVRRGQSFSSIAAKSGHSLLRLRELNPKLKPEKLQPGDRVRLRR